MQIGIRYILAFTIILGLLAVIFSDTEVRNQLSKFGHKTFNQVTDIYPDRSCNTPMAYKLGDIDARFGITNTEVLELLAEAEAVWENSSKLDLFLYDDRSPDAVPINLIFDERQESIISARRSEVELNQKWSSFEDLIEQYEFISDDYKNKAQVYDIDVSEYETLLEEFNASVDEWNTKGGSRSEYEQLKEQEFFVKTVFQGLEKERENLQSLADTLNELADNINKVKAQLNRKTDLHNHKFADSTVVHSGDFDSYEINIYQYYDFPDLRLTLAHELGHALGIDHVDDTNAIMYYLLESQDVVNLKPTEFDLQALFEICEI